MATPFTPDQLTWLEARYNGGEPGGTAAVKSALKATQVQCLMVKVKTIINHKFKDKK